MVPIPVDADTYLCNMLEYTQVQVQYPYVAMTLDSYLPLMEKQFK